MSLREFQDLLRGEELNQYNHDLVTNLRRTNTDLTPSKSSEDTKREGENQRPKPFVMPQPLFRKLTPEEKDDFLSKKGWLARSEWHKNNQKRLESRLTEEEKASLTTWYEQLKLGNIERDGSIKKASTGDHHKEKEPTRATQSAPQTTRDQQKNQNLSTQQDPTSGVNERGYSINWGQNTETTSNSRRFKTTSKMHAEKSREDRASHTDREI